MNIDVLSVLNKVNIILVGESLSKLCYSIIGIKMLVNLFSSQKYYLGYVILSGVAPELLL